jgi:hypothetical protein
MLEILLAMILVATVQFAKVANLLLARLISAFHVRPASSSLTVHQTLRFTIPKMIVQSVRLVNTKLPWLEAVVLLVLQGSS